MAQVLHSYGLTKEESTPIVEALSKHPKKWVDFMMRFELGLEKPDPKRAFISAFTIAASYIAGGLISLAPYVVTAYLKNMTRGNRAAFFGCSRRWSPCSCSALSKVASPAPGRCAALCKRP